MQKKKDSRLQHANAVTQMSDAKNATEKSFLGTFIRLGLFSFLLDQKGNEGGFGSKTFFDSELYGSQGILPGSDRCEVRR